MSAKAKKQVDECCVCRNIPEKPTSKLNFCRQCKLYYHSECWAYDEDMKCPGCKFDLGSILYLQNVGYQFCVICLTQQDCPFTILEENEIAHTSCAYWV